MVSCGQQGGNGKKKIYLTKSTLEASLKKQKFECESIAGAACPSGIARLFIFNAADPEDSALCSGFLNGDDKVVTNNHCLSTLEECKDTYISIYNGESYENVKCKSIIATKADPGALSQKGVDYTIMEIDRKVAIKTFSISKYPAYVGDSLTAWVIDHKSLTTARITELDCTYRSKSNSMLVGNCPVIHGNSGSPMVNSSSEIVGVIWGSTVDQDVDERMELSERRRLDDYALVTALEHFKSYLSSK
jgi:V8-like Glu-specific endopeptidase